MAGKHVIVGALLLLNAYVWPQWLGLDGWVKFAAVLLIVGGIVKYLVPYCPHCKEDAKPAKKGK
ncbi:hypothetical protein HYU18_04070 [Candidatus Woesearchaeota archaeon]|nr:hypothetical protein [Candidatus Woesearchaeota archaeon]